MNIIEERENLRSVLSELDERLIDFKELVNDAISYDLDYSVKSIKYVELLLPRIGGSEDDENLLSDAALYVGETIRRHYQMEWDIYDKEGDKYYGQPYLKNHENPQKRFFPFVSLSEFFKTSEIGFFLNEIR